MNERTKALNKSKREIYREIALVKDDFASFSPLDKLTFVERAFNHVNNYYSHIPFGLNPNFTKFGFFTGKQGVNATAFINNRAIAVDIESVLSATTPMEIYKTMFHEFRHIWQFNASLFPKELKIPKLIDTRGMPKPMAKVVNTALLPARNFVSAITKPFRFIGNSCLYKDFKGGEGYSVYAHEASLNEIDADLSAFNNLEKIFERATLKLRYPEVAEDLLARTRRVKASNMKWHAKAVANVLSSGKLFPFPTPKGAREKGEEPEIMGGSKGPVLFFSLPQIAQVISSNPKAFSPKVIETSEGARNMNQMLCSFAKSHGEERHVIDNFFGRFSACSFSRKFKQPELARLSRSGRLIDQEELESGMQVASMQKDFLRTAISTARELREKESIADSKACFFALQKEDFMLDSVSPLKPQEEKAVNYVQPNLKMDSGLNAPPSEIVKKQHAVSLTSQRSPYTISNDLLKDNDSLSQTDFAKVGQFSEEMTPVTVQQGQEAQQEDFQENLLGLLSPELQLNMGEITQDVISSDLPKGVQDTMPSMPETSEENLQESGQTYLDTIKNYGVSSLDNGNNLSFNPPDFELEQ